MSVPEPTSLEHFFDIAIQKIAEHPTYAEAMSRAAEAQEQLILNYHTHGPGHGYCASICVQEGGVALLDLGGDLKELVHMRGIGKEEAECQPLMKVFADRLVHYYDLKHRPVPWLNGSPVERS